MPLGRRRVETESLNIIIASNPIDHVIFITFDPNPHPSIDQIRTLIRSDPDFEAIKGMPESEGQDWFIAILTAKIQEWIRKGILSGDITITKY